MKYIFLLLFVLAVGVFVPAYQLGLFDRSGEQVIFIVEKGDNFARLAKRLKDAQIIRDERAFRWFVNFSSHLGSLKRGEFGLYKNMSAPGVVWALTQGKPMEYRVTIPEGFNIFQIAELLEQKGLAKKSDFIAAAKSHELIAMIPTVSSGPKPKSIEGYIFPDTYNLQKVFSAKEIAIIMMQKFHSVYSPLEKDLAASAAVNNFKLTPHQIITLASIVEKETGVAEERPLVAGLFFNRITKRMRLQTDPTVIYAIYLKNGSWDGDIHRSDLNDENEYNTYHIDGLPPGPIASPGISAIKAVLNPTPSDYLYFVSKNNGTHIFSKDYKNHQQAVQQTQLAPHAKEGKSWRDLPAEKRANK